MAAKVNPIPDGFHRVTPHLIVRDALKTIVFYEKAFGAEVLATAMGPDGKSVMHATIQIGDSRVMLADEFPDYGSVSPMALGNSPVTIHLYVEDVDAAWKRAVDAGAEVVFPLGDQFWGDRYGVVKDPSGHKWSLGAKIEDVTPEECSARAAKWFAENK